MSDESTNRMGRQEPPSPTLRDVLAVMFRQKRIVMCTMVATLAITIAYVFLAPSYQAHMKVLLRRGRVDPVVSPEKNSPIELTRPEISEEELNSEVELLRDQALLRRVVEQNGLAKADLWQRFRLSGVSKEMRIAQAVRRLASRLKVEPIRKTNLIRVSYASSDPDLAARVLNSVGHLYLEKHKEVRRSAAEFPFFAQQAERSRQQLDESELRVVDFSRFHGVVSGSLERDLAVQRAADLDTNYQQVQVTIQETTHRADALAGALASFPERTTSLVRTGDNPELQGALRAKLLELELKRTELLTKYEPGYRLVQEVEQQIAQTKAAIAADRLAPVHEETTDKDPNYEWAKAELSKAQVELKALKAREEGVRSELSRAQAQAQRLGVAAIQQQDLLRNMKTAEESYLLFLKKTEEARIGDALDERGIVNVMLVEPPLVPMLPERPVWLVMFIGLIAAAVTSTGMAFAMDYLDPAFRTPEEVAALFHAPVLASLPRRAA